MSDTINLKIVSFPWDMLCNGYMAFSLADGTSDGTIYDSQRDAARFNDPKRYAFFCFRIALGGANARDCQLFLNVNRAAADAGIPMAEPDIKRQRSIILSTRGHDILTGRTEP